MVGKVHYYDNLTTMMVTLPSYGLHAVYWPQLQHGESVAYLTNMVGRGQNDHVEVARWTPDSVGVFAFEIPPTSVCYHVQDGCAFFLELLDEADEVKARRYRVLFLDRYE